MSCDSYQVTERRKVEGIFVKLYLHCNACRQDMLFWTGTVTEERVFKRRRSKVKRILGRLG